MGLLLVFLILFPMLCSVISYFIRSDKVQKAFICIVCGVEFAICVALCFVDAVAFDIDFLLINGIHLSTGGFRSLYLVITSLMWLLTTVFSVEYTKHHHNVRRYNMFNLMTLGAVLGVFSATDLMTVFVFFEILSFTSFTWVIQEETPGAIRAANTYLAVAVIGGLILFMGLLMLNHEVGTLNMELLYEATHALEDKSSLYVSGILILLGFGAKAGMFPLHIWLPKAHPVAPAPASALLSGVLTKVGVFGIIVCATCVFSNDIRFGSVLLLLAVITMFLGALLALFSTDLKHTLACSSMSQIGFILIGVALSMMLGHHNGIATAGTVLHMTNHSLIKCVLFTVAGIVFMNTHTLDLNRLKGYGRNKPLLMVAFLSGALGIGGIPLFNGYISKTLLHEAIIELPASLAVTLTEWIFLISGGLTVAYMTKLFVVLFVEKPENTLEKTKYMSTPTAISLLSAAVILPILGNPSVAGFVAENTVGIFNAHLEHLPDFFAFEALKGGLISIAIGFIVYFLFVRTVIIRKSTIRNLWPRALDMEDNFYRPLLLKVLPSIGGFVASIFAENKLLKPICRGALKVGAFISKLVCDSLDLILVFFRHSVFRDKHHRAHIISPSVEIVGSVATHTFHSKKSVLYFAEVISTLKITTRNIKNSFSFALISTCVGVCGVLIYILLA